MQNVSRTFSALKNVNYIGLLKFWASNYHAFEVFVKIKSRLSLQNVSRTFSALKNVNYIGLLKVWASNYHAFEVFVKIKSIIYALVDHTCRSFCLIIEVGKCHVYSINSWLCYSCWATLGPKKKMEVVVFNRPGLAVI